MVHSIDLFLLLLLLVLAHLIVLLSCQLTILKQFIEVGAKDVLLAIYSNHLVAIRDVPNARWA